MKKIISLILILAVCSCCFGTFAENAKTTEEIPVAGLNMTYPQSFRDARGLIGTDGPMKLTDSVYLTYWYYTAVTEEEYQAVMEDNQGQLQGRTAMMYYVFSIGDSESFSDVAGEINDLTGWGLTAENAAEIGQAENWKFYLYMAPEEDFGNGVEQEYADEYTALCGMRDEIASSYTFSVPFNEYGRMDGEIIRFTATDLDGNPVSSADIFNQNNVTMINIWATWCGPCISELAELQAIHTRFREKDCGIVGLLIDTDVEEARRLINENGITYPVYLAGQQLNNVIPFEAVPTSFFADRSGAFLGTKFTGAYPELYESALEPLIDPAR